MSKYAATRNFKNGAVTYLSPYISRGVISTKIVFEHIKSLGLAWSTSEKLVQELAWRDYWQQIWIAKGDLIKQDLKNKQTDVQHYEVPKAVVDAQTGIHAVDKAIEELYETGYMHNHMRMYVAAICCNIAGAHWLEPAKWLYSHLLDGDLASNHLSWQWIAGAFSNKKYVANQDNINRYFESKQKGTFLDIEYSQFKHLATPPHLQEECIPHPKFKLPKAKNISLDKTKTTLVYNYYNLDPYWHSKKDVQRVFLVEPSFFNKNPISQKAFDFALQLSANIKNIQIFVGEFSDLAQLVSPTKIIYKEHPTNIHYKGKEEARDWMCSTTGYHPSFFRFWKKCKKEIQY